MDCLLKLIHELVFVFSVSVAERHINTKRGKTTTRLSVQQIRMSNQTQQQRLQHLKHVCINDYYIRPLTPVASDLERFEKIYYFEDRFATTLVNDDYKLLVTVVYKTGSENWKKLFTELFKRGRNSLQRKLGTTDGIYTLAQLYNDSNGAEKVAKRLKNYFSVIFVRHPYSRMLSAFMSKFVERPNAFYAGKARYIISKVRRNKIRRKQTPDLKFNELVQYVTGGGYDEHWCPIFREKKPCHLLFDFVGHLETFRTDVEYLFHILGIDDIVDYPTSRQATGSSDINVLKTYFSQVTREALEKLNDRYKDDFKAFGYRLPKNCSDFDNIS